jgi:phage gp36-like protein
VAESHKTLISAHTEFATGTDLIAYRDWRHVGDLLNDDDTRPSSSGTTAAHANVTLALRTACGQIETAMYRGGRYTRADVQALLAGVTDNDGAGYTLARDMLRKLACDLAFWILVARRKPDANPNRVAGVGEALAFLQAITLGEAVLPFQETVDASVMDIAPLDPSRSKDSVNAEPVSTQAGRMFGARSRTM